MGPARVWTWCYNRITETERGQLAPDSHAKGPRSPPFPRVQGERRAWCNRHGVACCSLGVRYPHPPGQPVLPGGKCKVECPRRAPLRRTPTDTCPRTRGRVLRKGAAFGCHTGPLALHHESWPSSCGSHGTGYPQLVCQLNELFSSEPLGSPGDLAVSTPVSGWAAGCSVLCCARAVGFGPG